MLPGSRGSAACLGRMTTFAIAGTYRGPGGLRSHLVPLPPSLDPLQNAPGEPQIHPLNVQESHHDHVSSFSFLHSVLVEWGLADVRHHARLARATGCLNRESARGREVAIERCYSSSVDHS